jgi:hypothetical protein
MVPNNPRPKQNWGMFQQCGTSNGVLLAKCQIEGHVRLGTNLYASSSTERYLKTLHGCQKYLTIPDVNAEKFTLITQSIESSNPPRSVVLRLPEDRVLVYIPRLALVDAMGSYWGNKIDKEKSDTYGNATWLSEHEKGIDSRPDKTFDPSDVDWLPDNVKNLTDLTITLRTEQISSVRYTPGPESHSLVPFPVNFADFNLPVPASAWHGIDWRSDYKPWRWAVQPGAAETPYRPTLAILASHLRKVHTTFDCQDFYYMVDPPSAFETVESPATEIVNLPEIGSIVIKPRQTPAALPMVTATPRPPSKQAVPETTITPGGVFATVTAGGSVVTAYQSDNNWVIGGFRIGPNAAQQVMIDGTALEVGADRNLIVGGKTVIPSTYAPEGNFPTGGLVEANNMDSGSGPGRDREGSNDHSGFVHPLKAPNGNKAFESDITSPESGPETPRPGSSSSGARKSRAAETSSIPNVSSMMLWITLCASWIVLL